MKKILLLLIYLFSHPCFATIEYVLDPSLTFVTTTGDLFDTIYQDYTGHCESIEFHEFEIYKKESSTFETYRTVLKADEWSRTYVLYENEQPLSKHQAHFGRGSFFDAAKQFDVQDAQGNKIGYIQGRFFTKYGAEFLFYRANGDLFATAQLDKAWSHLTLKNLDEEVIYTCYKTFHFNLDSESLFSYFNSKKRRYSSDDYYWTINYDDRLEFDSRFFWPFMCFISEVWWPGLTD